MFICTLILDFPLGGGPFEPAPKPQTPVQQVELDNIGKCQRKSY